MVGLVRSERASLPVMSFNGDLPNAKEVLERGPIEQPPQSSVLLFTHPELTSV
jgi:hypothetical protein